jgi:hypothetical protein
MIEKSNYPCPEGPEGHISGRVHAENFAAC